MNIHDVLHIVNETDDLEIIEFLRNIDDDIIQLLVISANNKNVSAIYVLGLYYLHIRDKREIAFEYFLIASSMKLTRAMVAVALYYEFILCDHKNTMKYYKMAISQGSKRASRYFENYMKTQ